MSIPVPWKWKLDTTLGIYICNLEKMKYANIFFNQMHAQELSKLIGLIDTSQKLVYLKKVVIDR